jgi:LPS O-antigen subunit length determinant protein (WzzB/FepE family)
MEHVQKKDEVDLMELFLNLIIAIRKHFWLIILFFFLGTALGSAYYFSVKKVYQSKMVVSSNILTSSYSKELFENINRHRGEQNTNAIKTLLNVSDSTAKNFAYLEIAKLSQTDDLKEADRFIITADVLDKAVFPELEKGLVYYLENNEFVKIRVEQNKKYMEEMLAKVNAEIIDMERFKEKIMSGTFFENAKGNVMFDPTTVNSKILELTKEKLNLQNSLELVNSVQVIEGFTQFERPTRPHLSISLISGSLIGLFFVGILIAFKSIRKLLKMADEAKATA